jgi:hypothetical protein
VRTKVEAHDDVAIGGDGDDARQIVWIGRVVVVVERQFDISPFQMKDNAPPRKFGPLWPSRRSTRRELRAADAMVTVAVACCCVGWAGGGRTVFRNGGKTRVYLLK